VDVDTIWDANMQIGLVISRIRHWNRGLERDRFRLIEDYKCHIVDEERLIVDLVSTGMTPKVVRAFVNELGAQFLRPPVLTPPSDQFPKEMTSDRSYQEIDDPLERAS
jgi:hypothetical protein